MSMYNLPEREYGQEVETRNFCLEVASQLCGRKEMNGIRM